MTLTTTDRLKALSTPALMALFTVCHDNYGWPRRALEQCESVPGRVGKAGVKDAIKAGFLWGSSEKWEVFKGKMSQRAFLHIIFEILQERWPAIGCVCACNQCILPYTGDDIEGDNPTWTTSDKVLHVFDGICEPVVPTVRLWMSVTEDGLISKWDHSLPKTGNFIDDEGYPVRLELTDCQAQQLEHARRKVAKRKTFTGEATLR